MKGYDGSLLPIKRMFSAENKDDFLATLLSSSKREQRERRALKFNEGPSSEKNSFLLSASRVRPLIASFVPGPDTWVWKSFQTLTFTEENDS